MSKQFSCEEYAAALIWIQAYLDIDTQPLNSLHMYIQDNFSLNVGADEIAKTSLLSLTQMVLNEKKIPFKIKIDSFHEHKAIVDLKIMKDMLPVWNEHEKVNFVEYYGYDIQLAIYQEIVYQNTGEKLPCFLCVGTKETTTDLAILEVDNERLDFVMENIIKPNLPRFKEIKEGKQEPEKCGHCQYCVENKVIEKIINYKDLDLV